MIKKLFFEAYFRIPITALMFLMSMLTSVGMVGDAQATPAIMAANGAPACASCHAGGAFTKAEGKAGLAAYLASQTPTCKAPQVLDPVKNVCVTPVPVCKAPQVLDTVKNVCVTPTPVCKAPQVLDTVKNVCVTPVPVCKAPQVLDTVKNVCVTPAPVCKAPQVLDTVKNVCVTPAPVCKAPQVLDTVKNVCVTPAPICKAPQVLDAVKNVCITPAPTACGDTDHDDEDEEDGDDNDHDKHHSRRTPTLSAPDRVSVHAGELLTLAVTAFDCEDRQLEIKALELAEGATIVNSIDPDLHMHKAVISWTPSVNTEEDDEKIVLKAVATDVDNKKTESARKTVKIKVLPALHGNSDDDHVVKKHVVAHAKYTKGSKKLGVGGQVIWDKGMNAQERKAIVAAETAVISNAVTGDELGTAKVRANGKWAKVIPISQDAVPCSIDVSFHGKTGGKVVKGVNNCKK